MFILNKGAQMNINTTTGNNIVDEVGKMDLTGNIIPEAWYKTISKNGKPCAMAILLLADIVYWYRPTEHREETTQNVYYSKKFKAEDYLQRNYEQITAKFGITKKQARDALTLLENLGVIKRHFRTLNINGIKLSNVMFIELNPEILKKLTFPKDPLDNFVNTPSQKSNTLIPNIVCPASKKDITNTKNTTNNTTNNTTTAEAKPQLTLLTVAHKIFKDFNLSDDDILAIIKLQTRTSKNVTPPQNY